ncbi:YidC/Oxa1 family membrane protein insertase [Pseudoclostridium thermosuccinogenes]|uniref:YidC/Oxa1 family membrane protein insertase n=1 Tax=Clostridium thermosuccinogenes TaxID=84032 RepID=UPI002FDABA16
MFNFISRPLGQFMYFIYNTVGFHNYGLAIIIFTIIVRLLMLPLTVKQYRSNAKLQEIQPQLQEIQKRYKNDKEKLNAEMMKLYQENNVNPAGGCLPLLIQMPILFALWGVISRPLTYMLGRGSEVKALLEAIPEASRIRGYDELSIVIHDKLLNMDFLGLNLGLVPTYDIRTIMDKPQYAALLLIPILASALTYFSSKLSMSATSTNSQSNSSSQMSNTMMIIGPLMTLMFSFQFPAGLGLYWIAGSVIQILQQLYINKHVIKKKEVAN